MPNNKDAKDTNLHTENLQGWDKGDILTAKKLQQPVTFIKRAFGSVQSAQQVVPRGSNVSMKKFYVVEVRDNYMLCKSDQATETGDEVNIALPPEFRKQVYDFSETGGTLKENGDVDKDGYKRTLPNGRANRYEYLNVQKRKAIKYDDKDETEIQVIVPAYVENDIIFAAQGIQGGTDATDKIDDEVEVAIDWQDLNVSGRAWSKADDQDDES